MQTQMTDLKLIPYFQKKYKMSFHKANVLACYFLRRRFRHDCRNGRQHCRGILRCAGKYCKIRKNRIAE